MSALPIVDQPLRPDPDFGAPVARPRPRSFLGLAGAAALAVGAVLVVAAFLTASVRGSWLWVVLPYGLVIAGAVALFVARYRGTSAGIKHDNLFFASATSRGLVGWTLGVGITAFYVLLYWFPEHLEGGIRALDPLARPLSGADANQWFLYGLFYTLAVLVMGVRMFWRYRHNRYQIVRTASVMFFQLGFAFLIPQVLRRLNQPEFYFSYFWPLKPEYLFPGTIGWLLEQPGGLGTFMVGWGVIVALVATPVLTYFLGKRWYCSWVCGCGGLAETLGDPFRHLSDKSNRAWRIERWMVHSVLVAIVVVTALLWIADATGALGAASQAGKKWYGFFIGAVFSGVVGVGFYPLLGSRVWCRFGCPQAAILGIVQRFFSRFRITTNGGQCMSCGNCSTYCEMGIDVRSYAMRGENIVRASCVGCGVCSAVCPRGVLKLESGPVGDRFDGANRPLSELGRSLGLRRRPGGARDHGERNGSTH